MENRQQDRNALEKRVYDNLPALNRDVWAAKVL